MLTGPPSLREARMGGQGKAAPGILTPSAASMAPTVRPACFAAVTALRLAACWGRATSAARKRAGRPRQKTGGDPRAGLGTLYDCCDHGCAEGRGRLSL